MFDLNRSVGKVRKVAEIVLLILPCGYINGSRRLIARVAQKRMIPDVRSTPLSTTDEITDRECEITAATIFTMRRH